MKNLVVTSVVPVRTEPDEEAGMPSFIVRGTWKGEAFKYEVAVELDGRDADWEHKGGVDPQGEADDGWLDEDIAVYEAIYASPGYKEAAKAYLG